MKALLALLAAGKLGKVALTGGTMVVSVFAYALVFGVWYAAGLVALIFVHEMGHFLAARSRGLEVGAPTFIPFVGAWIELKQMPHDVETEAWVGLAGPLLGSIGALARCSGHGNSILASPPTPPITRSKRPSASSTRFTTLASPPFWR